MLYNFTVKATYSIAMWLGATDAGRYLGYSATWIEARALKWQDEPMDQRIRYKLAKSDGRRRYYVPDLDAQQGE
jgi:hypothetical protein